MAKHLLVIKGDYNDADYITEVSEISDKDLARLRPIFNKIKKYKSNFYTERNDWENRYKFLTEDEVDIVENYIPYAPEGLEIHTLDTIRIYNISGSKTYL